MKCPAKLTIIPKRNDLIYAKMLGWRNRFYVNFAIALNETSYDDWTLESSNEENHSNYCSTQVPFHSREYSQFIRENGTPQQIQEDRRKYCINGPGQTLARHFRLCHTTTSMRTGQVEIKRVAEELNFESKGAEFMAKIVNLRNEEKSSRYFQSKNRDEISGIDSKLLTIIRASDDIFADGVSEQCIHIDQEQPNFIPILATFLHSDSESDFEF